MGLFETVYWGYLGQLRFKTKQFLSFFLGTSRMVRNYNRTYRHVRKGKSYMPYQHYTTEDLEKAVSDVKAKVTTKREAANKYNVPRSTIARYCREVTKTTQKQPGHPTLFNEEEEEAFIKYCLTLADWGFPLDTLDLRIFAQRYLNKIGKNI